MKKQDVVAFESYLIGKPHKNIPIHLLNKMYEFLSKFYHMATPEEFMDLIIRPKESGELVVLYGAKEEIAGFCRTFFQKITMGMRPIAVYVSFIYFNPVYKPHPTSDTIGLNQGIQYKLNHPEEEVIYLAFTNNPFTYAFFYQFVESFYPKPSEQVPDQIIKVVNALKKQNGWISTGSHPMVINSPLVPIRSSTIHFQNPESELNEFYLATNSDYMQGNSLLIYIPLNLANIHAGLNEEYSRLLSEKSPHHLRPNLEDPSLPGVSDSL